MLACSTTHSCRGWSGGRPENKRNQVGKSAAVRLAAQAKHVQLQPQAPTQQEWARARGMGADSSKRFNSEHIWLCFPNCPRSAAPASKAGLTHSDTGTHRNTRWPMCSANRGPINHKCTVNVSLSHTHWGRERGVVGGCEACWEGLELGTQHDLRIEWTCGEVHTGLPTSLFTHSFIHLIIHSFICYSHFLNSSYWSLTQ